MKKPHIAVKHFDEFFLPEKIKHRSMFCFKSNRYFELYLVSSFDGLINLLIVLELNLF